MTSPGKNPSAPPPSADEERARRILLVEDEQQLCMTLGDRLRGEGYGVEIAYDARSGLEKAGKDHFDLIILDVMLPMGNGLDVCMQLRKFGLSTPILFLSARGQSIEKVAGFKAGADDYVTKPFDTLELMARVEMLLNRFRTQKPTSQTTDRSQFGPVTLDVLRKTVTCRGEAIPLTSREFQLLRYLAEHGGRTISREELLEHVWGNTSGNITRTVDMHIATLRQKLESNPRSPELILTEPGVGYRFQPW